jgi:hypothetical protein
MGVRSFCRQSGTLWPGDNAILRPTSAFQLLCYCSVASSAASHSLPRLLWLHPALGPEKLKCGHALACGLADGARCRRLCGDPYLWLTQLGGGGEARVLELARVTLEHRRIGGDLVKTRLGHGKQVVEVVVAVLLERSRVPAKGWSPVRF